MGFDSNIITITSFFNTVCRYTRYIHLSVFIPLLASSPGHSPPTVLRNEAILLYNFYIIVPPKLVLPCD